MLLPSHREEEGEVSDDDEVEVEVENVSHHSGFKLASE